MRWTRAGWTAKVNLVASEAHGHLLHAPGEKRVTKSEAALRHLDGAAPGSGDRVRLGHYGAIYFLRISKSLRPTTLIKGPCDNDDDSRTSRTVGHGEAWQPQGCQASGCQ